MAYRLKNVQYHEHACKILLQNENGPCPLLAAANALLLRGVIKLPSECIRNGVASIDDVTNLLAERALKAESEHHLHELMEILPKLQYGMDVNPKFTAGPTGVEYTSNLTAFDLINVELVHGWLLDPQDAETSELIEKRSYNELIELVVHGNEASIEVERLTKAIAQHERRLKDVAAANENDQETKTGQDLETSWVDVSSKDADKDQPEHASIPQEEIAVDDVESTESCNEDKAENQDMGRADTAATNDETKSGEEKEDSKDDAELNDDPIVIEGTDCTDTAGNVETSTEEEKDDSDEEVKQTKDSEKQSTEDADNDTKSEQDKKKAEEDLELPEDPEEIKARLEELRRKHHDLSVLATEGSLIKAFLTSTSHQLTHYGLIELYNYLSDGSLCVFFRNNHFATLTKHDGVLYLLVTDLGYANVPEVMWEKLDEIDGNTEYVDCRFVKPAPRSDLVAAAGPQLSPEQMLAQGGQNEADYQLAIQLSKHGGKGLPHKVLDEEEGKLLAAATEASLREYNGVTSAIKKEEEKTDAVNESTQVDAATKLSPQEDADRIIAMQLQAQLEADERSERLARELQAQENRRAAAWQSSNTNTPRNRPARTSTAASTGGDKSSCTIS